MELLVVTGLSGAGKSLAVNALEDIGYFCIDNIPAGLMPRLLDFALQGETMLEKVAVVVDIRGCRTQSDVQEGSDQHGQPPGAISGAVSGRFRRCACTAL